MNRLRFVMVGGFLGAGKTTTLARLARFSMGRGQKVGLVTNDQAQDLVDTTSLRSQGFPVEEVPGACFCCRFNDLVDLLLEVVSRLQEALARHGGEVAHLKAIGLSDVSFGVANLVSSQTRPELSLPARGQVTELDLIVNARVAVDPALIEEQVREAVTAACAIRGACADFRTMQSFRPGRPQPTHRYAAAT